MDDCRKGQNGIKFIERGLTWREENKKKRTTLINSKLESKSLAGLKKCQDFGRLAVWTVNNPEHYVPSFTSD